jgi:hypothetical protein
MWGSDHNRARRVMFQNGGEEVFPVPRTRSLTHLDMDDELEYRQMDQTHLSARGRIALEHLRIRIRHSPSLPRSPVSIHPTFTPGLPCRPNLTGVTKPPCARLSTKTQVPHNVPPSHKSPEICRVQLSHLKAASMCIFSYQWILLDPERERSFTPLWAFILMQSSFSPCHPARAQHSCICQQLNKRSTTVAEAKAAKAAKACIIFRAGGAKRCVVITPSPKPHFRKVEATDQ